MTDKSVAGSSNEVVITRKPVETWLPVWWTSCFSAKGKRIKAIAGNPSKTGKTVRIRAYFKGGVVERSVSPKNLEPRLPGEKP